MNSPEFIRRRTAQERSAYIQGVRAGANYVIDYLASKGHPEAEHMRELTGRLLAMIGETEEEG